MTLPFANSSSTAYSFLIQLSPDSTLWIQIVLPSLQNPSIHLYEILNLPLSTVLTLYPNSFMQVLPISFPYSSQTEEVDTNPEIGSPVPQFFSPSQSTDIHVVPQTEVAFEEETQENDNNDGSESEEEF